MNANIDNLDRQAETKWEKEIERDLMLLLQTWHASKKIQEEIMSCKGDPSSIKKLVEVHENAFRQPVYFPLGGKVEKALGDAIAKAERLLLIECKVDACKGWEREALGETTASEQGKTVLKNKGGKNRTAVLQKVQSKDPNAQDIANKCHVLVAKNLDGNNELGYMPYWDYVLSLSKDECIKNNQRIDLLKEIGASSDEFTTYIATMLDSAGSMDATSSQRENKQILFLFGDGGVEGYSFYKGQLPEYVRDAQKAKAELVKEKALLAIETATHKSKRTI